MTDLSIVVPCYNESKNIPLLVNRFLEVKPKNTELILVDNGSTDDSQKIIHQQLKKSKSIKSVRVKKNVGYGFGIWTGLQSAKGTFICWTHADMQADIYDAVRAFNIIKKKSPPEKQVVKGKRKGRPFMDKFLTFGMNLFETILLRKYMFEINAQPNLFHRSFLNEMKTPPKDFSFDLYFYYLALEKGLIFTRFPVYFVDRIHGTSHWNTGITSKFKFIKRTILYSLKLRRELKN